jgi:Zn-dependent M28 family amino/carboxypeptidase
MKVIIYIFLVLSSTLYSQSEQEETLDYLEEVVSFLASDSLKGRATGSAEETISANYIFDEFKKNKRCKVSRQKFKFCKDSIEYSSQNTVAYLNNNSKKTILFSAHYDHLGMGGELSHSKGGEKVHNGADDNASGVALMLDLAKKLSSKKWKEGNYNILFVAYSGHEIGLYGSKHFSEHIKRKYKPIELVVNFDMVGRLNSERKVYFDCSEDLASKVNTLRSDSVTISKSSMDRINLLDTKWFVKKGVPSITFSTGKHIDYHKASDDIKYIDFKGILWIERMVLDWIETNYFYSNER